MDFLESLRKKINTIAGLKLTCNIGYLEATESLKIYPLPGGQVKQAYFDGVKDQELLYEIAIKTKSQQVGNNTLWQIQDYLEQLSNLGSGNDSFQFDSISISDKPYLNEQDEQGFYIYLIDFTAKITTFN